LLQQKLATKLSVRRCEEFLYAGPKPARNILTNLNPNPA